MDDGRGIRKQRSYDDSDMDSKDGITSGGWRLKLLHDGLCPICAREVRLMQRLDRHRRLAFEDIADPRFDPAQYGLTLPQVIGVMHGVLPDGRIVRGMETFRLAYRSLGLGWLVAPTDWPGLRWFFDRAYGVFARVRPRFSRFKGCDSDRCAATNGP